MEAVSVMVVATGVDADGYRRILCVGTVALRVLLVLVTRPAWRGSRSPPRGEQEEGSTPWPGEAARPPARVPSLPPTT